MDLLEKLEKAKAQVFAVECEIKDALCSDVGHDWVSHGGANAGCDRDCRCSVPVHRCSKCGDFDYGENDDAVQIRKECAERWPDTPTTTQGGE